jgi:hypothetical protein
VALVVVVEVVVVELLVFVLRNLLLLVRLLVLVPLHNLLELVQHHIHTRCREMELRWRVQVGDTVTAQVQVVELWKRDKEEVLQ